MKIDLWIDTILLAATIVSSVLFINVSLMFAADHSFIPALLTLVYSMALATYAIFQVRYFISNHSG